MTWQEITKPICSLPIWFLLLAGCQGDRSQPLGPTLATKAVRVQERGSLASALFLTYDASGCLETRVTVVGSEGRAIRGPGAPTPQASASVSVIRHDWCAGLEDSLAQGSTSDGVAYRFNGSNATLRATIPAQGSPGKAIRVDMAWAAEGTVFSSSTRLHTKFRGTGESETSTTRHYWATASGTVSMDGLALAAGETPAAYMNRYRTTSGPDTGSVSPVMESAPISGGNGGPAIRFQGMFATAQFRSVDEAGCVESFPTIEGFVERQRGKDLLDWSGVGMFLFQIDHCTGTSGLEFNVGIGGEGTSFQVNRQHTKARAQTSFKETDFSGNEVQVDVDVGWTAGQFARHGAYFERRKEPDCRLMEVAKGSFHEATARGTVTLNGRNVSPEPAFAAIMSYQTDRQRVSGGSCFDD